MSQARLDRVRRRLDELGLDALLISIGADLPWLTGYTAMPLPRLTMLVLPAEGDATLVVPRLEAPRVTERRELFALRPWEETEDPVAIVAELVGSRRSLAISDRAWAAPLLALQASLPDAKWQPASVVTGPLRAAKDPDEIAALRKAAGAACPGIPCEDVDAIARRIISDAGYGPNFVHRTGHGIGLEEHEDPFIVAGNCERLVAGNAFSVEPGIYIDGKWGARIEDIIVATEYGPDALNTVDHSLCWVG